MTLFPLAPNRFQIFLISFVVSCLIHAPALYVGFPFILDSRLFSYTLLTPIVCLYLVYTSPQGRERDGTGAWIWTLVLALLAGLLVVVSDGFLRPNMPGSNALQLWLSYRMSAWVLTFWAVAWRLGGLGLWSTFTFPMLFLAAVIPISPAVEAALESWLQSGSAAVFASMLTLTGPVFFRTETVFQLPGITLEIAPECSGINSTLVLFITSLVAGYLFLRSPWRRAALALAVIPLALLRNGFRVWVLAQLCVHDDPRWIDSDLHHKGGPIFFALSLLPFGLLLFSFYRRENKKPAVV